MKKFESFLLFAILLVLLNSYTRNSDLKDLTPANINISIGNTVVVEGNTGKQTIEVTVILSEPAKTPVNVSFSTKNGSADGTDYTAANGTITFNPGERVKKINIGINEDQSCEPNETFEVVLSNPSGASLAKNIGKITIVNDDFNCPSSSSSNSLGRILAVYEVRLTFQGYTSFSVGPPDCPIRSNGKVVLTGLLSGAENTGPDDDIMYTGILQLDIDMDICSVKRQLNGEDKLCGMTVMGFGTVNTELEIYYDQRGGYVNIEDDTNEFIKLVFGNCNGDEMYEEQDMVPNRTIASIFNGYELTPLTNRTLTVGSYTMNGEGGETVVEVIRKIQ